MIGLPLDTAFVIRAYPGPDGRAVCDLSRSGLGAADWVAVPVLVLGGGPGRFLLLPPGTGVQQASDRSRLGGAEVVIGFLANRKPVVLGLLSHPRAGLAKTSADEQATNEDLTPAVDPDTAALAWDDALLAMRNGHIAMSAAEGKNVSAQLNGGALRVSQNGESDDWAVLALALVDALAPLYAKVNEQDEQIASLTAKVIELCAKVSPPSTLPELYTATELAAIARNDIAAKALRVSSEIDG